MIVRELLRQDTSNKTRLFLEIVCDNCNTTFFRQKRQYVTTIDACSGKCRAILQGSRLTYTCDCCGNEFTRPRSKEANSTSGKMFCSRKCKETAQKYMPEIQPSHYGSGSGKSNYRTIALDFYGAVCTRCGYSANIKAIEVHHKDRNRNNNCITNLEVLCCNCHAIEHRT